MIQFTPADAPPMSSTPPVNKRRTWPMIIAVLFCAAVIPETITTFSTSPLKMVLQPIALPFIMLFYGPAVLLTRELIIRRRLGWSAIILLGLAFGIMNEGVAAGTWYTVQPDGYLYLGQYDVAWIAALEVFHLFISIILNVAFVDALFPRFAGVSLLGKRGMIAWAIWLFCFNGLVAFAPTYRAERLLALAGASVLIALALVLPSAAPRKLVLKPAPDLWQLRWLGFGALAVYFAVIYLLPTIMAKALTGHATVHQVDLPALMAQGIDILAFVILAILLVVQGRRWTARDGWALPHTLAVLSGTLVFGILFSLVFGWALLEPVLTVPFAALLVVMARRAHNIARSDQSLLAGEGGGVGAIGGM